MKPCNDTKRDLMNLAEEKKIYLEGSILKVLDAGGDPAFEEYLKTATEKDKEKRRRGLDITKDLQKKNLDLESSAKENQKLMDDLNASLAETEADRAKIEEQKNELERISEELKAALDEAEVARKEAVKAKEIAENDLDILQKKSQFELIGTIVRISIWVIIGVGVSATGMYIGAMILDKDTTVIGPAWSNLVAILLTNAFSIVGTIMGVKYGSDKN